MDKENWDNLAKDERRRYMQLQMSPQGGYDRSGYLPDDCGACGQPTIGCGWCLHCRKEWGALRDKLMGKGTTI